jgi:subtilisin-like proprotein convertase family protein
MALAAAAIAQPTASADLGSLTSGTPVTGAITGFTTGSVKWIKFTIGGVTRTSGDYLDIDTNGVATGTAFTGGDTLMALYDNTGAIMGVSNDDSGPGSYSMVSFGATTPTRAATAAIGNAGSAGAAHAGGTLANLPAGTYWLGITGYVSGFSFGSTGWSVTSAHTRTGDVGYRIAWFLNTTPTNPSGVGSFSPTTATNCGDATVLASVLVTNGGNPTSTGVTVTADLSSIGGSTTQTMFDNGTNGDVTANDGRYSFSQLVAATTTAGSKTFGFSIRDAQNRTATGTSGSLTVTACPLPPMNNEICDFAQAISPGDRVTGYTTTRGNVSTVPSCTLATGTHMAWYKVAGTGHTITVSTCDTFSNFDTVVAAYCGVDGCGSLTCVASNDDNSTACTISSTKSVFSFCTVPDARYLIAVGGFSGATGNFALTVTDNGINCTPTVACGQPTSPTGVGSFTGTPTNCGDTTSAVTLKVTVTGGTLPASTGLQVIADLSPIGGSIGTALYDDGTHGDVTAGDKIFTLATTVASGVPTGTRTITYGVSDLQGRSSGPQTFGVTVTQCPPPAPSNDNCAGAIAISIPSHTEGYTAARSPTAATPACSTPITGPGVYYLVMGTGTTITASTCDAFSNYDTKLTVYCAVNGCAGLTCITANDDDSTCTLNSLRSKVSFCSVQGAPYLILVHGFSSSVGNFGLNVSQDGVACNPTIACGQPTNPSGVGSYTGTLNNCDGTVAHLTVATTGGQFPPSSGITVTADTTVLGGGAGATMYDDGTHGDITAGDGTFSLDVVVSSGAAAGSQNVGFTVSDNERRSSTGNIAVSITQCTGGCCIPSTQTCSVTSPQDCASRGGTYLGAHSNCGGFTYGSPFSSGDTFPIAIADNSSASTSVTVAGSGATVDGLELCVGLTHTFPGDLIGTLSNGVHSARLFNRQGGSADVGGTYCFATDGTATFAGGSPSGIYSTTDALTVFAGDPADGTWTLTVSDNATLDTGTIDSLTIAFGTAGGPCTFCPPCAADYDQNGGVDGADVSAFFSDWENGQSCADVDGNGGIDGGDVDFFFRVWELGGC